MRCQLYFLMITTHMNFKSISGWRKLITDVAIVTRGPKMHAFNVHAACRFIRTYFAANAAIVASVSLMQVGLKILFERNT